MSDSDGTGVGGNIFVDTEKSAAAIPMVSGFMQRLAAISNYTSDTIGGLQLNRGDSYGEAFAQVHDPLMQNLVGGLSDASGVFDDTSTGIQQMMRNYANTDDTTTDIANSLTHTSDE